jgi:AcrR family transcriptional regulator
MSTHTSPAKPRQRNQRGDGTRLKDELVQAAMRILDRAPAADLSLRMVAREAGVAAPSVYPHFKDADTMMSEIVRACWIQLGDEMSQAASHAHGGGFAALKARMGAYVRYAMERPSRYQLLFAMKPVRTGSQQDLPGLVQPAYRNVIASIEIMSREGHALPTANAVDATMLVLSLAHGRIALAHTAPHRPGNATAGVQSFVIDMLERLFSPAKPKES